MVSLAVIMGVCKSFFVLYFLKKCESEFFFARKLLRSKIDEVYLPSANFYVGSITEEEKIAEVILLQCKIFYLGLDYF